MINSLTVENLKTRGVFAFFFKWKFWYYNSSLFFIKMFILCIFSRISCCNVYTTFSVYCLILLHFDMKVSFPAGKNYLEFMGKRKILIFKKFFIALRFIFRIQEMILILLVKQSLQLRPDSRWWLNGQISPDVDWLIVGHFQRN